MSGADYLKLGDWNANCSMCGFKFKASQLTKNWQGMYRCSICQESRQPQDFVRAIPDIQTPPWVQDIDTPIYATVCGPNDQTAIPHRAVPSCVTPNNISPSYDSTEPYSD